MAAAPGETPRPEVGDMLVVVHDFVARSPDELSLSKGDRVELSERDDEFGDGWYLGRNLVSGNSGLFPAVYTRVAPKNVPSAPNTTPKPLLASLVGAVRSSNTDPSLASSPVVQANSPFALPAHTASLAPAPAPIPFNSNKSSMPTSFASKLTTDPSFRSGKLGRLNMGPDSHVLHETLNVINEHITDMNVPQGHGRSQNTNDSSSEYSSQLEQRLSYIQGEETDEEEHATHSRSEVQAWSSDQVAEYLFTAGVEKQHCEVFRDQEITGEVLLGLDQTSLFIKALDLGSVGRRLKTWQKIKALQDDVNGFGTPGPRATSTLGSDAGSDMAGRSRSRTDTLTSSGPRLPSIGDRIPSVQTGRHSTSQNPLRETARVVSPIMAEPVSPTSPTSIRVDSPTKPNHDRRLSASSVRDLFHARRHSSTDFRFTVSAAATASAVASALATPELAASSPSPMQAASAAHKKQPSFDRNWTLGSATTSSDRPQSSAGVQDVMNGSGQELQDSAVDLDRGYFSGPDIETRRRNVLRKRESVTAIGHSRQSSFAEEQRVRSATVSKHSRFGSMDSSQDGNAASATRKYYGLAPSAHRRTVSTATNDPARPMPPAKDSTPAVTRLDEKVDVSPKSPGGVKRLSQVNHPDFNMNALFKGFGGMRAASEALLSTDRSKVISSDPPSKDSPMYSPSRTESSTPSVGPSFELDSPDATKSQSTTTTTTSRKSRKTKKETSAYTRGLQNITPREAIQDADYSGWMKKKSSNLMTTWKPRLFVLRGRRLAYYYSEDDEQEKGLIDISFHRVLPADNERLTGLHATLTGASTTPTMPAGSNVQTTAETDAKRDPTVESDAMFIFKLVPPRAGLPRAVTFTKPMVHYFAVPNIKQGRLWMAALMKATIDRDDTKPITTSYQQKTISLAKARQMRHRPPALMNLDEKSQDLSGPVGKDDGAEGDSEKKGTNGLGIYDEVESESGIKKLGLTPILSTQSRFGSLTEKDALLPQNA